MLWSSDSSLTFSIIGKIWKTSENRAEHFMKIVSKRTICMSYQAVFSGKKRKIFKMLFVKF